ncbi:putative porin [Paraburkholderia sp. JPY171]|nr:putative porin [Paraburkholderia atlantica]
MKAIFVIENGFDVNAGKLAQGDLMFSRQAYVGMSSQFDMVTLGSQYDSVVDYVGPLEVGDQAGGAIAAHPEDVDNFNNTCRTNNTVKYISANYNGLTLGGTYSFDGIPATCRKTRSGRWGPDTATVLSSSASAT